MKAKRILALCIATVMVISMAACKKEKNAPKDTSTVTETTSAPTVPTTPEVTTPVPTTTPLETVPLNTDPLVPQDRIEGTYEQWLGATAVVGVFMQYPGAQIQGIYALSDTRFEQKMSSKGVVIYAVVGDTDIWLKCMPLEAERDTTGTRDLYAIGLGYNTFDKVEPVKVSGLTELTLEELQPYMELTVLPTISYH